MDRHVARYARSGPPRWTVGFHLRCRTPLVTFRGLPMERSPKHLIAQWRDDAETLRARGAPQQADALSNCAEELEAALREHDLEAVTLNEASQESGYSYSTLQKKVASGELPSVGTKNCPRVRRGDLPRKAGQLPRRPSDGEPDLAGTILTGR